MIEASSVDESVVFEIIRHFLPELYDKCKVSAVPDGNICDVFCVSSEDGDYYMRIRPPIFKKKHVVADHSYMRYLLHFGFRVPSVVPTTWGSSVLTMLHAGTPRMVELLTSMDYDDSMGSFSTDDDWSEVGRFMGDYHRLAVSYPLNISKPDYVGSIPISYEQKYFSGPLNSGWRPYGRNRYVRELLIKLAANLDLLDVLEGLPKVILHNDFCEDNVLLKNGQLDGLIDFDFCLTGPHIIEVVEGLHGAMVFDHDFFKYWGFSPNPKIRWRQGEGYLAEYQRTSGLSVDVDLCLRMLEVKILSLIFYPGFCPASTHRHKMEILDRAARTLVVLQDR